MDRSIDFWSTTVGFQTLWSAGEFAFLDGGPIQLVLNQVDDAAYDSETEIVIEVDDVRSAFTEMRDRGVRFQVELRPVTSDGERDLLAAHFADPDGNLASVTGWVARD
jgi:hypothetical protein